MIVEWLWAVLFGVIVLASAIGLRLTARTRDPMAALASARNLFISGIVVGLLGAAWIATEAA